MRRKHFRSSEEARRIIVCKPADALRSSFEGETMRGAVAWLFITTFCFLVFPVGAAQGQSSQGTSAIAGKVVDPTDVEISGVRVTLLEESTARNYVAISDCSGFFLLSGLEPGTYTIKFESAGFRTEARSGLRITKDKVAFLHVTPRVAQATDWQPTIKVGTGPLNEAFAEGAKTIAASKGNEKPREGGEIQGTVFDPSGAVLAGAQMRATNEISGEQYESTSGADGSYRFSGLSKGSYSVLVRHPQQAFRCLTLEVSVNARGASSQDFHLLVRSLNPIMLRNPACAPLIETEEQAKFAQGIALEAEAELKATAGSRPEVWTTVKLKNTSGHPIVIPTGSRKPGFAVELVELYGSDTCAWPVRLRDFYMEATSADGRPLQVKHGRLRMEPGQIVSGKFEMGKLFDLSHTSYYIVEVRRHDTSATKDGIEQAGQTVARSNWITIEAEGK